MSQRHLKHVTHLYEKIICKQKQQKQQKQQEEKEEEEEQYQCWFCCSEENLKFINCKKGGIQNIPFGKWGECCKDKAICLKCRKRMREKCPFCEKHALYNWKKAGRGPKKKEPFAIRHEKQTERLLKRLKKKQKYNYLTPREYRRLKRIKTMENI
tara:strand:+ start:941 stop:1405 length:465 start_codon:yes stop_codon:yes gene_type:complete